MNDASGSTDEEEFQSSSEDIEIKPWDLPYWRGAPKKDKEDIKEVIEEDVEVVEPITVEELEAIRNEGYEEGFLQGLNEGREKGEKEGYDKGLLEGKEEGNKQGQQEGNRIGFEAGHAEGMASGKEEIAAAAEHLAMLSESLEKSLKERDLALPQVLSQLIQTACRTIIERELEQGDDQISQKVLSALDQLPRGAENIQISISPNDALHLENGLKDSNNTMHFDIDASLESGSAKITSKQSLIEFSHAERMQEVFEYVDQQCEKLDLESLEGETEEVVSEELEAETVESEQVEDKDIKDEEIEESLVDEEPDEKIDEELSETPTEESDLNNPDDQHES